MSHDTYCQCSACEFPSMADRVTHEFAARPADVEYVTTESLACGQTAIYFSAMRGDRVRCLDSAYAVTLPPVEVPTDRRAPDALHAWELDIITTGDPWAHPSRAVGEPS